VANVTLEAVLENGKRVHGETRITASRTAIRRLHLNRAAFDGAGGD